MRAVPGSLTALVAMAGLSGVAQAESAICPTPEAPEALSQDGAALDLDAFNGLTADMDAYDRERAAYVMCLNSVIFRDIEASSEEIEAAREARGALYVRDPATGFFSDPVLDRYSALSDAFFAAQQVRATQAAEAEAQASVVELNRQLDATRPEASANK